MSIILNDFITLSSSPFTLSRCCRQQNTLKLGDNFFSFGKMVPENPPHDEQSVRLKEPLLIASNQAMGEIKGRIYASNQPKILLEVLSARTATLILVVTWLSFILCMITDLAIVTMSFDSTSNDVNLTTSDCALLDQNYAGENIGCGLGSNWTGVVYNLENIITVQLNVLKENVTIAAEDMNINTAVTLYACYQSNGCGNSFSSAPEPNSPNTWHQVLQQTFTAPLQTQIQQGTQTLSVMPETFQNQESIPSKGTVKSYYIELFYQDDITLFAPIKGKNDSVIYTLQISNRQNGLTEVATLVLLIATLVIMSGYVYFVVKLQNGKWLTEQKWIVAYLVFLIFFQNPGNCSPAPSRDHIFIILNHAKTSLQLLQCTLSWRCRRTRVRCRRLSLISSTPSGSAASS